MGPQAGEFRICLASRGTKSAYYRAFFTFYKGAEKYYRKWGICGQNAIKIMSAVEYKNRVQCV